MNRPTTAAMTTPTAARFVCALLIMLLVCCPAAMADNDQLVSDARPLLHTFVEVKAWGARAHEAVEAAFDEMERVNDLLNNYDSDSEVSRINAQAGALPVVISQDTREALQQAVGYAELTGGAFDFTIGPLLKLWGFVAEQPGLTGRDPDAPAISTARMLVDYRALELAAAPKGKDSHCTARLNKKGMWIDVGAFSKGFVADKALQAMKQHGTANALIAAGGTICAMGIKPDASLWQVGIRHPRKEGSYMTIISLKNGTVSTSGDYERYYDKGGKRRGHIIDPRSGLPVERMQSVSVIAPTGVLSDALSTALFVLGPEDGIKLVETLPDVHALVVSHEGGMFTSKAWPQKTIIY